VSPKVLLSKGFTENYLEALGCYIAEQMESKKMLHADEFTHEEFQAIETQNKNRFQEYFGGQKSCLKLEQGCKDCNKAYNCLSKEIGADGEVFKQSNLTSKLLGQYAINVWQEPPSVPFGLLKKIIGSEETGKNWLFLH